MEDEDPFLVTEEYLSLMNEEQRLLNRLKSIKSRRGSLKRQFPFLGNVQGFLTKKKIQRVALLRKRVSNSEPKKKKKRVRTEQESEDQKMSESSQLSV